MAYTEDQDTATPPSMDPILAKDYPGPIREIYTAALRREHPTDRHRQLVRLGEASLAYLASLAFADYRRARHADPSPDVEEAVRRLPRATAGDYLNLFRVSQRALGQEMFEIRRYEVNVKLDHAQRLAAAVRAVERAQRIGARNLGRAIEEGVHEPVKAVRWLDFWNQFVEYRNRVVHADDKGWPVDVPEYYELMTPLVESALVEALRTEYIAQVLLEYPIAEAKSFRQSPDGWTLHLDGEYRGAPLLTEIPIQGSPGEWRVEPGTKYVLERSRDDGWTLFFRFYDLRSGELPPAPEGTPVSLPPRSRSGADVESGVTSSTAALQTPPVETDARGTAGKIESAAAPDPAVDVAPGAELREFGPATRVHPNATFVAGPVLARRAHRRGQTFGKQVLEIRATGDSDQRLPNRRIILREFLLKGLLFGPPSVFLLGLPAAANYLWPLFDRRSKALHDHICETRVVAAAPKPPGSR